MAPSKKTTKKAAAAPKPFWRLRKTGAGYRAILDIGNSQEYSLHGYFFKSVDEAKQVLKGEITIVERTITQTVRKEVSK